MVNSYEIPEENGNDFTNLINYAELKSLFQLLFPSHHCTKNGCK